MDVGSLCEWKETGLYNNHFQMYAGEAPIATLRFTMDTIKNTFAMIAVGEWEDQRWQFSQKGWWYRNVSIADPAGIEIGEMLSPWWILRHGTLTLKGGGHYLWRVQLQGWKRPRWVFSNEAGVPLLEFIQTSYWKQRNGTLTVRSTDPQLRLLMLLGWYLVVRDSQHD